MTEVQIGKHNPNAQATELRFPGNFPRSRIRVEKTPKKLTLAFAGGRLLGTWFELFRVV